MSKHNPETGIVSAILEYLTLRQHFAWRQNNIPAPIIRGSGGQRSVVGFRPVSMKGISDILGVYGRLRGDTDEGTEWMGRIIAIEVKQPGKKPTPEQAEFLASIRKKGGIGFVATSVDDVIAAGL